jgi:hypothetical protein
MMSGKTYKTIETPGGIGEIRKGGAHVAKVFYRLIVKKEILTGAAGGLGELEIEGEVSVSQDEPMQSQVARNMSTGDLMTLHLEDGRKLDIRATTNGSSDAYKIVPDNAAGFVTA